MRRCGGSAPCCVLFSCLSAISLDVGILAMECYFPQNCILQTELEAADGCAGKYTVGLGQNALSYFTDCEACGAIHSDGRTSC